MPNALRPSNDRCYVAARVARPVGNVKTYVYIACMSHSGSTLLEKLLATSAEVFALGEVCHFSSYADDASKYCGCGMRVPECSFWQRVLQRLALAPAQPVDAQFPTDSLRSERRSTNLLYHASLVAPGLLRAGLARCVRGLSDANRSRIEHHFRVMAEVDALSARRVFVDKSMAASRLLELVRFGGSGYRLCAIHLVRDGRAVAHSHRELTGLPVAAGAREWRSVNRRIELALRRAPVAQLRVRYEDLCDAPEMVLTRIAQALDLPSDYSVDRIAGTNHAIGGNYAKLTGYRAIARDERYLTSLSASERAAFETVAGPLNSRYGYA